MKCVLDSICNWSGQDSVVNGLLGFLSVGDPVRVEVEEVIDSIPHNKLWASVK